MDRTTPADTLRGQSLDPQKDKIHEFTALRNQCSRMKSDPFPLRSLAAMALPQGVSLFSFLQMIPAGWLSA